MKVARYSQEPIVLEFGMLATLGAIALLDRMRQAGAEVWWFDGDRDEAFQAWKNENGKSGRVFDTGDAKWGQVVRYIDDNRDAIDAFFGSNIVRTIGGGLMHVPPQETFGVMFRDYGTT